MCLLLLRRRLDHPTNLAFQGITSTLRAPRCRPSGYLAPQLSRHPPVQSHLQQLQDRLRLLLRAHPLSLPSVHRAHPPPRTSPRSYGAAEGRWVQLQGPSQTRASGVARAGPAGTGGATPSLAEVATAAPVLPGSGAAMEQPGTAMVPGTDTNASPVACDQQPQEVQPAAGVAAQGVGGQEAAVEGTLAVWPPAAEQLEAVERRLRARPAVQYEPVSSRAAAVLLGLFADDRGVVRVLLTRRSARLSSHRGEVCLPGGKRDEGDDSDAATALREAQEELGLDPSTVTVLGALPPVLSKHHLSVTPVLALVPRDFVPRPNPGEVDAAFTVPLAVFLGDITDPRVNGPQGREGTGAAGGGGSGSSVRLAAARDGPVAVVEEDGADGLTGRRTRQRAAEALAVPPTQDMLKWRPRSASPPPRGAGPTVATAGTLPSAEGSVAAPAGATASPVGTRRSARVAAVAAAAAASAAEAEGSERGQESAPLCADTAYLAAEHVFQDIRWGQHKYRIHSFQYGEFDVWGLTATICIAAAQLALGRPPAFQERCPGGQHYSAFYYDGTTVRAREPPPLELPSTALAAAGEETAPVQQQQQQPGAAAGDVLPSLASLDAAPEVSVEAIEMEAGAEAEEGEGPRVAVG